MLTERTVVRHEGSLGLTSEQRKTAYDQAKDGIEAVLELMSTRGITDEIRKTSMAVQGLLERGEAVIWIESDPDNDPVYAASLQQATEEEAFIPAIIINLPNKDANALEHTIVKNLRRTALALVALPKLAKNLKSDDVPLMNSQELKEKLVVSDEVNIVPAPKENDTEKPDIKTATRRLHIAANKLQKSVTLPLKAAIIDAIELGKQGYVHTMFDDDLGDKPIKPRYLVSPDLPGLACLVLLLNPNHAGLARDDYEWKPSDFQYLAIQLARLPRLFNKGLQLRNYTFSTLDEMALLAREQGKEGIVPIFHEEL